MLAGIFASIRSVVPRHAKSGAANQSADRVTLSGSPEEPMPARPAALFGSALEARIRASLPNCNIEVERRVGPQAATSPEVIEKALQRFQECRSKQYANPEWQARVAARQDLFQAASTLLEARGVPHLHVQQDHHDVLFIMPMPGSALGERAEQAGGLVAYTDAGRPYHNQENNIFCLSADCIAA